MPIIEDAKKLAERMTGIGRPGELSNLVRERKPATFRFKDDGAAQSSAQAARPLSRAGGPAQRRRSGGRIRTSVRAEWLGGFLAQRRL